MEATVTVRQTKYDKKNNEASWRVNIKHLNPDLCPLGEGVVGQLNWHVHQYAGNGIRTVAEGQADPPLNADGCGADDTGGHYDPTFACGGASQNNRAKNNANPAQSVCEILRDTDQSFPDGVVGPGKVKTDTATSYAAACNGTPVTQSVCEIGDQSGKMGKLKTKPKNLNKIQKFTDEWMTPIIDTLEGRSLVLHCCYEKPDGTGTSCGPRLACANLE